MYAIDRAWEEALRNERTTTGVMVHVVPDEGVDDGPVLGTARVPIDTRSTLEHFAAAMHAAEHRLLVEVLGDLCDSTHSSFINTPTEASTCPTAAT